MLPGNHDPASGPGAVWSRRQFRDGALPPNVTVLREPAAIALPGGHVLLASPLRQKKSPVDPSLCLRDLARAQSPDRIKIGLTHGALAIPGKHQPNDFPVDPAAATRAGLDYLGLGHWHNWQVYDAERLVMPGTPEPDAFDQPNAGFVAYVEIDGPAASPRVTKLPVGGLQWTSFEYEFGDFAAARPALEHHVSSLGERIGASMCRVRLKGPAVVRERAQAHDWLRELFGAAFHCQVQDHTHPMLSPGEIVLLEREHPILCQVLADLAHLEMLATGRVPADLPPPIEMSLSLARSTCARCRRPPAARQPRRGGIPRHAPAPLFQPARSHRRRMILHQIEAASVGPFVGAPVVAGPFKPGLNILAAPNETGKTTLLRAAGRALFDRHTCKDAEIRALKPAGSALAPRVVVDFETAAGCFRIDKTFLQGPRSTLFERIGGAWKPVAEADAADGRVQALLQSTQPGRGATKAAAHWGLLGFLWTRQGEPAAWFDWDETRRPLRARDAGQGGD